MKKTIVSLAAVCTVLFCAANAVAQTYTFYSDLNPANEVPPLKTGMVGLGVSIVTFNEDGTSTALIVASAFNYETPITASHIHIGDAGIAGPVICPMTTSDFINPVIRICNFTEAQTTALLNGGLYLNVHTQANPGGEIRDQLWFAG